MKTNTTQPAALNAAITKLERKSCDLVVLNGASAINSSENEVEIIAPSGNVIESVSGSKQEVAQRILSVIQNRLIIKARSASE